MLNRDSLDKFNDICQECRSHEDAFDILWKWYQITEQRSRILSKWKNIRLSEEMKKKPEELEAVVFRAFVAQFVTLQKQIGQKYHVDGLLFEKLMTAVFIPKIQAELI